MKNIDLSVIIVNWNTRDLLRTCISSLKRYLKSSMFEIIVVDNGSTDGSAEMIEREFSECVLIRNTRNLGFSKANNIALARAQGDFICLLNSDTELTSDPLGYMLDFMRSNKGVAVTAPALRLPNGSLQVGAGGFVFNLGTAFNSFFFLSRLFPELLKGMFFDQVRFVKRATPVKVGWLSGACLMVRASAIKKAGGLDESFFMYAEDVEWCDRLRRYGDIYYLPAVEIVHHHGASAKGDSGYSANWLDALCRYYGKNHNKTETTLFCAVAAAGFFIRMVLNYAASLFNPGRRGKARMMRECCVLSLKRVFFYGTLERS